MAQRSPTWMFLAGLGLALAVAFAGRQAQACSCLHTSPAEAFASADRVFAGEMVARTPLGPRSLNDGDGVEFTFVVTHVWKGAGAETIRVRSSGFGGACGYDFSPGTHYLVYARAVKGALWTGLCSRNSDVRLAVWDRMWLPTPRVLRANRPVAKVTSRDLIALLNGDDQNLQFQAVEALGGSPEIRAQVLPILRDIVRGRMRGNAAGAAHAIGQMGEDGRVAQSDLAWLRSHGTGPERANALEALIRIGDPRTTNRYVLDALSDPTPECLKAACEQAHRLAQADSIEFGRPAAERLARLIRHPDFDVRAHAIFALEAFPATGLALVPALETISQTDTSSYVRYAARLTTMRLTGRRLPFR